MRGFLAAFVFAAPAVLHAEGVRIAHEPAGSFAVLAARFDPATVTVEASGCQTSRQTANWGDHGTGQQFLLRCP